MSVVEVARFGGPEVLQLAEWPDPTAGPGQVVVRIAAATVNPTDLSVPTGDVVRRMPDIELPVVPGWDLAGEVTEIGDGVDDLHVGQRVAGMIHWRTTLGRPGAYGEFAAVPADWVVPVPDGLDDVTAATIPLNALTARQALDMIGAQPGTSLLVTGASGAVGAFGAQLAVQAGLRVLAVASHDDEDFVASLGVEEVLPRHTDLETIDPVDNVFDAVPIGPKAAARVAEGGAAVFTRPPGDGAGQPGVRFETVLVQPDRAALRRLVADVADGLLTTRVAQVLPLGEAERAHRLAAAGGLRGKVVLTPGPT